MSRPQGSWRSMVLKLQTVKARHDWHRVAVTLGPDDHLGWRVALRPAADGTITCSSKLDGGPTGGKQSHAAKVVFLPGTSRHPDNNLQTSSASKRNNSSRKRGWLTSLVILYECCFTAGSERGIAASNIYLVSRMVDFKVLMKFALSLSLYCTYCIRECIFEWFSKISLLADSILIGTEEDVNLEVESDSVPASECCVNLLILAGPQRPNSGVITKIY